MFTNYLMAKRYDLMKLSLRKALLLYTLVPVLTVFILFAIENILSTKKHERELIESHMTDLAKSYVHIFNGYLIKVAEQADIVADLLTANPEFSEDEIFQILEQNVKNSKLIHGMAVAFVPYKFNEKRKLFSPYAFRKQDTIKKIDIALAAYDYTEPQWEWWHNPIKTGKGGWTEPYFDEGAGNIIMSTYSVPFFKEGKIRGVATVDIPLHKLNSEIETLGITKYKVFLLSGLGKVLISSDKNTIGRSVDDVVEERYQEVLSFLDKESAETMRNELQTLSDDMLSGNEGKRVTKMRRKDQDIWYFYAPIRSSGWSAAIGINEREAFKRVYNRALYTMGFFSLLLFLLIVFISLAASKLAKAFEWILIRCQRIERMNFQKTGDAKIKIEEIRQLSRTLDGMCEALDAHFSNRDDLHLSQSLKLQPQAINIPELAEYQIKVWSNKGEGDCTDNLDIINLPQSDQVGFLLFNNADRGMDASIKNAQLKAIYRTAMLRGIKPNEIASQMNGFLFSDSSLHGAVQLWLGVLQVETGGITHMSLGHNIGFYYSESQGVVQIFPGNSMALSMHRELPGSNLNEQKLLQSDVFVVCSEGVFTALNRNREAFTFSHIENIIQKCNAENAEDILNACKDEFLGFTRDAYLQSECTIMVIKRNSERKSTNRLEL